LARRSADECRRFVAIGERYDIVRLVEHPALNTGGSVRIVGAVTLDDRDNSSVEQTIRAMALEQEADALLVVSALPRSMVITLGELSVLLGCRLVTLPPTTRGTMLEPSIAWEGEHPFVEIAIGPDRHHFDRRKRVLDVVLAGLGLVVAIPVVAIAAGFIVTEGRGNPFFGHVRIGRGGRRFRCWKLRTMHTDAEQRLRQDPQLFEKYRSNDYKLPDEEDPRITRIGRILRKSSLDELPQLWNVVVGDMSLVGPRPIVAEELQHYRGQVLTLLSVRPGVTGAWAVNGRHHLPYPKRADVELAYVRDRSAWLDLKILTRTVGAVLDPGFGLAGVSSDNDSDEINSSAA
jgi:lipopolysaccharide/colanic/teichoic acid biosynthesis glycosyltransferase